MLRKLFNVTTQIYHTLHYINPSATTTEHVALKRDNFPFSSTDESTATSIMKKLGFVRDLYLQPAMPCASYSRKECYDPAIDVFCSTKGSLLNDLHEAFLRSECKNNDYSTYIFYGFSALVLLSLGCIAYKAFQGRQQRTIVTETINPPALDPHPLVSPLPYLTLSP